MTPKGEHLFPEVDKARYGEGRRSRRLFLPRFLEAPQKFLEGPELNRAHEIICKWADIDSSGKLKEMQETAIEGEFCKEVFGDALGYDFFADNKERWNFQQKFSVNGGQADAAIGIFGARVKPQVRALIEIKGPTANVDRDRVNGRTAVQQCWDYLNARPECPWGIVCNYVSFRLYHRNHTPRIYELFTLQDLRKKDTFLQFYYLLEKGGLLPTPLVRMPRADSLLEKCLTRERQVGDELYARYHDERLKLIAYLSGAERNFPLDKAIRIAQKLLDRIVFVAFCEDRNMLPEDSLKNASEQVPPFHRVTNPRWQNFLDLFSSIDEGNEHRGIPPYDGGLFRKDPDIDDLQLDDEWTSFFKTVGSYDFAHEINVDVLGHLFEKSINDIEQIRLTGVFEPQADQTPRPKMAKSAERKKGGIYYTPPEFTGFITDHTVGTIINERIGTLERDFGIRLDEIDAATEKSRVTAFAERAIEELRDIKVVDPACGSGAFLIRAYEVFEDKYVEILNVLDIHEPAMAEQLRDNICDFILHDNLFGVDLSPEAVEIAQLALWLRSAHRGKTLADLSKNIICGNSLISEATVDPHAFDWQETFSDVFRRPNPGFDCVIGNPPWERMKLQEREFFDLSAPEIASATSAATRRELIEELKTKDPDLYAKYLDAGKKADGSLGYIRNCGRYPLTGKGDVNCYQIFAELAHTIVSPTGRVGLLVPTGIATDKTNEAFFAELVNSQVLSGLYDFENKAPVFPDVHRSYKFSVLLFGGSGTKFKAADFVFFAHKMDDLKGNKRHIALSASDFKLLNPNTRTCPVFRSKRDANLTKYVYKRVPVLINKTRKEGGNPWGVRFFTMFHQTNDAELFHTADQLKADGFKRDGAIWKKRKQTFLPLYEAKMIQMFDHRAASVVVDESNWMRQGQTDETSLVQHQNPEFTVEPRWWVDENSVDSRLQNGDDPAYISYKDITSPTNQRTMIAAFIPKAGVLNSAPLKLTGDNISHRTKCCLLSNLNSICMDFVARQKVGGVHLNFFIVEQLPIFPPEFYKQKCPWNEKQTLEKWISDRVLKLSCTSNDMIPLAEAANFEPRIHKWDPADRLDLMAELDAAFFLLYGIKRPDVEYILSTFSGVRKEGETLLNGSSALDRILAHYDALSHSPA
ncbi:MAG TPA: DNA methyltransferase [Sedimentisphaerales bacterium]|nr:DNA methyltransferase [Sedimentisphaerales bacterium]